MNDSMTKNVIPISRRSLRREKSSRTSSTLKWNDPSLKLNSSKAAATPSLEIKDYDAGFALRKIALLYENDQNEAAANIISNISWSTLKQIYSKFPIDLFVEAVPKSLCILDTLYSRFFLKNADKFPTDVLPLGQLVLQMVKLYARKQSPDLPKVKDWEQNDKHMRNLLKMVGYVDGRATLRMLRHRRQCLDRAVNGLGTHGLVEVEVSPADEEEIDKKLMNLSEGLFVELNRMVINCKRALNKITVLEKNGEFESLRGIDLQKYQPKNQGRGSKSNQYAPVVSSSAECNHQRIFELNSEDIQGRLYQNKVILNVLEPIMHYAQLPWLLTVLQERIERDKDLLLTFSQLRKEIMSVTPNAKLAPALTQYAEAFTTVINILKKYVTDDDDNAFENEKITSEMDSKFSLMNFNLFEYNKLAASSGLSGSLSGSQGKSGTSVQNSPSKDKPNPDMQEIVLLRKESDRLRHELHKAQRAVERLRNREKDLLDRLTKSAESSLENSKSFEKISPHVQRPSDLVQMYKNLYSDSRVHALDGVERALQVSGRNVDIADVKNKLLFSVIVLAFRFSSDTLDNLKLNIRELLCMSIVRKNMMPTVNNMEKVIDNYLQGIGDSYDLRNNCQLVFDQVCDALYDCPQLRSTSVLYQYVEECVKLSWLLTVQNPPYIIEYDSTAFDPSRHDRFHTSNVHTTNIQTYLWPSLIDKQAGRCLAKGIVITDI